MLSEKAGNAFSEYGDCTEEIKQNSKETKSEQDKKYSGLVRKQYCICHDHDISFIWLEVGVWFEIR